MGFLSRELRGLSIAINIAAAGMVAIFVYIGVQLFVWDSEETKIWAGLEASSKSPPETHPFGELEFICFTAGSYKQELDDAGRRLGRDFFLRSDCGKHGSCCNINSDGGGIIATVKDGTIYCKQTDKFWFVVPTYGSLCTRPDTLVVRKRVFTTPELQPHYAITTPGTQYFEIGEKTP